MKLQYLGDARDAFKWDLLHWICTRSSPPFSSLTFVPLLTPDVKGSNEGRTPHHWFHCREFIRSFIISLRIEPRSLARIPKLGTAEPSKRFHVSVFSPEKIIDSGTKRAEYWSGFEPDGIKNSVVFYDPDNGFETETQHGTKWIRHGELEDLFDRLPETSVVVVYQHRPHRKWPDLFAELSGKLGYVHTAIAVHESNLAFVAMAGNGAAGQRVATAIQSYTEQHPIVRHTLLRGVLA